VTSLHAPTSPYETVQVIYIFVSLNHTHIHTYTHIYIYSLTGCKCAPFMESAEMMKTMSLQHLLAAHIAASQFEREEQRLARCGQCLTAHLVPCSSLMHQSTRPVVLPWSRQNRSISADAKSFSSRSSSSPSAAAAAAAANASAALVEGLCCCAGLRSLRLMVGAAAAAARVGKSLATTKKVGLQAVGQNSNVQHRLLN
jgi:hypothetical protein